jgi:hypothetical protein
MALRRILRTLLLGASVWGIPMATHASPLGLRFVGTADLSAFGAAPESAIAGTVSWDRDLACGPGAGEGDFSLSSLEGGPPCVTATFQIDAIEYNGFDLALSRLMLFPDGMVLQLWFDPSADLDGTDASDLRMLELGLWRPVGFEEPVFPDIGTLPADLGFLSRLTDRSLVLSSPSCFDPEGRCIRSSAHPLSVVPEASRPVLLLVGLGAARLAASRQWRVWRRKASRP